MHLLDNPVWHALTGPQATVAEGGSRARRYNPSMAPFAALPDEPAPAAWDDLAAVVGDGVAVLFRGAGDVRPADGWRELARIPTVQMVAAAVVAGPSVAVDVLGSDDVPAMLALVEQTHPGPFEQRTVELGAYVGVRDEGALVAMAGERMRLPGHTEISAVCTAPTHQRRGLAAALVSTLVSGIAARGDTAFLHVVTDNVGAIRLYEALGFTVRRSMEVTVLGRRA